MPSINKLGATTKPATTTVNNPANVQASMQVATPNSTKPNASLGQIKVPAYLQKTTVQEIADKELNGYIGFAHPQSKNWLSMQAAGLEEGDIFLYHQGQYLKQPELKFFYATGESYKSVHNSDGSFLGATKDLSLQELKVKIGDKVFTKECKEHYICLCFVVVGNTVIPIKGDFMGTKSSGIEQAIRAVEAAGSEDSGWLDLSEAHKATRAFPHPFGRVMHTMRTEYKVGKSSGRGYHRAVTSSSPSSVSEMQLLVNCLSNEEFQTAQEEAYANFQKRIEFMEEACKKVAELNA